MICLACRARRWWSTWPTSRLVQVRRHHHPGEVIVYVLEGTLALQPDNSPPVLLHKGEILRNPDYQVHNAWNASDIAHARVYVVMVGADKGQPLATPDK